MSCKSSFTIEKEYSWSRNVISHLGSYWMMYRQREIVENAFGISVLINLTRWFKKKKKIQKFNYPVFNCTHRLQRINCFIGIYFHWYSLNGVFSLVIDSNRVGVVCFQLKWNGQWKISIYRQNTRCNGSWVLLLSPQCLDAFNKISIFF